MEDCIRADLKNSYGLTCTQITPVDGGWLNRKWKVSTDTGELLIKQFSYKRYRKDHLKFIEAALQRQIALEGSGVPCPRIRQCEGQAIRLMNDETAYMVMEFCQGKTEGPDTITAAQMRSLGDACGLMHKAFSRLPVDSVEGFPIQSGQIIDSLWENYRTRLQECPADAPAGYRDALIAQEPILKRLTAGFFDRLPKGIAHEDFSPDNMLFDGDHVSAIVDFDRNHYSYIGHDVGRAILSFALKDGHLDISIINAFVQGYSMHGALALSDMADILRLTWFMEIPWWIQPEFFEENHAKVVRFKDEMLWLTARWFELDSLFK